MYINNLSKNNVDEYTKQIFKDKIKQTFLGIGITNGINNLLNGLDVDTLSHIRTVTKQVVKIPNFPNNADKRLILLDQLKLKIQLIQILVDKKIPITDDMYGYINELNLVKLMTKIHNPTNNYEIISNKKKISIEFQTLIDSRKKELNELLQQKGVNIDKMLINILDYNDTIILKEKLKNTNTNYDKLINPYLEKYKQRLKVLHNRNEIRQKELKQNLINKIKVLNSGITNLNSKNISSLKKIYSNLKQLPVNNAPIRNNQQNEHKQQLDLIEQIKTLKNLISNKLPKNLKSITNTKLNLMTIEELKKIKQSMKEIAETKSPTQITSQQPTNNQPTNNQPTNNQPHNPFNGWNYSQNNRSTTKKIKPLSSVWQRIFRGKHKTKYVTQK
jgi:hypothetical protein